jgi:hypothetical protein
MATGGTGELPKRTGPRKALGCALWTCGVVGVLALLWWALVTWAMHVFGPHPIPDLAGLWEATHLRLPREARLVSARQEWTPGENNVWAVLEMPREVALDWLSTPPLKAAEPGGYAEEYITTAYPSWEDWDEWHPRGVRKGTVRLAEYEADRADDLEGWDNYSKVSLHVLADTGDGATVRVYGYWIVSPDARERK